MSITRKGLLQNYITNYDGNVPRYMNSVNDSGKWAYKHFWNNKKFLTEDFTFYFKQGGNYKIFQFAVPPQSVEITMPQRVHETKTFGGSVVEDYGNDTYRIVVSGSTINSDIRYYYSGDMSGKTEQRGDGVDEANAFRNTLSFFGRAENLKEKEVQFHYDRSSYVVYIQEYSVRQSKDNPLAYFYTVSMLAVPVESLIRQHQVYADLSITFKDRLSNLKTSFNTLVGKFEDKLDFLFSALQYYDDFLDIVTSVRGALERCEEMINNLVSQSLLYVDGMTTCIDEVVKLGDYTVSAGLRMSLGSAGKALSSVSDLVQACKTGVDFFGNFTDKYGAMSADIEENLQKTSDEIVETCKTMFSSMEDDSEELYADTMKMTSGSDVAVIPGGKDSSDTLVFVFGVKEYTLAANDTWDSIALKFYGDASKAALLNAYNSRYLSVSPGEMPDAGTVVYIPQLESSPMFNGDNEVYNRPDEIDNYGRDIGISTDGDFGIFGGDFSTTKDEETLGNAIINRLSTAVGSRVRDAVYGIKNNIGSTSGAVNMVVEDSIRTTLLQDPRIQSVESIDYQGQNDSLSVVVVYVDINNRIGTIGGQF